MTAEGALHGADVQWRPRIALVVVQGYTPDAATAELASLTRRVADRLNGLFADHGPHFDSFSNERLLKDAARVGERKREYAKATYWDALKGSKARHGAHLVIGVCQHPLPESSFNLEARSDRVAIVTRMGYEEYRPAGMTVEAYLMYLIVCVTMLLQAPSLQEHDESAGCLFDVCLDPADVTSGLRRPSFKHCQDDPDAPLGGWPAGTLDVYTAVLKAVGRKDPTALATSTFGSRVAASIVGVFIAFATNLAVSEIPRLALCMAVGLVAALAAYFALVLFDRRGWFGSHPRLVFWIVSCATVLLFGAISAYTWATGDPELPSERHTTITIIQAP